MRALRYERRRGARRLSGCRSVENGACLNSQALASTTTSSIRFSTLFASLQAGETTVRIIASLGHSPRFLGEAAGAPLISSIASHAVPPAHRLRIKEIQ